MQNNSKLEVTLFKPSLSRLIPLLNAENVQGDQLYAALQLEDRHVIFGAIPSQHWLFHILLLDTVTYLARQIHSDDLERFEANQSALNLDLILGLFKSTLMIFLWELLVRAWCLRMSWLYLPPKPSLGII